MAPLFDLLLAAIALLAGWGAPSPELTHAICAWAPAVLGALLTVPCYFLGARLLDRTAGVMAAAFIAVIPGPFLKRSLLGYADHHVAESLFATIAVLWLLKAIEWNEPEDSAVTCEAESSFREGRRNWMAVAVASLALDAYLLSWVGGSLLVFILFCGLMIQLVLDHLRRPRQCIRIGRAASALALALLGILPFRQAPGMDYHILALAGSALTLGVCVLLSRVMSARRLPRWLFPVGLLSICGAGIGIVSLLVPAYSERLLGEVLRFVGGRAGVQVVEAAPLLSAAGARNIGAPWNMFGTASIGVLAGLPVIGWEVLRRGRCTHSIIFVWTILVGLLTLRQTRFGYYFALHAAVLSGFLWSWVINVVARRVNRWGPGYAGWSRLIGVLLAGSVGWFPMLHTSLDAARTHTGPSPHWHRALEWLHDHSEEPFARHGHYLDEYQSGSGETSRYGVMCWWDYGYWVTTIAGRVPTANPTQSGAGIAARFFTTETEEQARVILDELRVRYVVVDATMLTWETEDQRRLLGKFHSLARWAGHDPSKYYETYLIPDENGGHELATLYYPSYYRTMATRLYVFGGRAATPNGGVFAVRFAELEDDAGNRIKSVQEMMQFADYAAARTHLNERSAENWRIVGLTPLETCVPLEALQNFRSVYQSRAPLVPESVDRARVEIFHFLKNVERAAGE